MKNKKQKSFLITLIIIVLMMVLTGLMIFTNNSNNTTTKFSVFEKNWIDKNKNKVFSIGVINNVNLFSKDGEGVFFDFINFLEDKTKIKFDPNIYSKTNVNTDLLAYFNVENADSSEKTKKDELIFYKKNYVLVSKSGQFTDDVLSLNGVVAAVDTYSKNIEYALSPNLNLNIKSYLSIDEIKLKTEEDNIKYIAMPINLYLENLEYKVVYNVSDYKQAYKITLNSKEKELNSIIKKTYMEYMTQQFNKDYNAALSNYFYAENKITDIQVSDLLSKKYTYGYIDNAPYEVEYNSNLIGLNSHFISTFKDLAGLTIVNKKYKSVEDLSKALSDGKVDVAFNFYNFKDLNDDFKLTATQYTNMFVILKHISNTDVSIKTIKSLSGYNVISTNTLLSKYINDNSAAKVKTYNKFSSVVKNARKDSLIAVDYAVYNEHKTTGLKDYTPDYFSQVNCSYGFLLSNDKKDKLFNQMFEFYMSIIDPKEFNSISYDMYKQDSKEINNLIIYSLIFLPIIILLLFLLTSKLSKYKTKRKESCLRYIDHLTSLKNRNYLNDNYKNWEENTVLPQTIIVISLNNIRHINDVHGHKEGDNLIKTGANILIRNQLAQSDLVRTDGNEYLIYLVGYEEKKIISYMRKLHRELEELPYGFGASLGYSMIEDDIKTIDDAINEAVLEIRTKSKMTTAKK